MTVEYIPSFIFMLDYFTLCPQSISRIDSLIYLPWCGITSGVETWEIEYGEELFRYFCF